MPQRESTVGASFVESLLATTERGGVQREALWARACPGTALPALENTRLPTATVIRLFDAAVALSGRADLGLEFARQVRPGTFHVLGYALMTCKTLAEAIALVPLYRRLVFDIGYSETRFENRLGQARFGWHVLSSRLPYCASLAESLIASWYQFGRWLVGVELPLQEVLFRHPAPARLEPYLEFFGCPVRFGAGENTLVFSDTLLDIPLLHADEQLHLAMRAQAQAELSKTFGDEATLPQRLRQALLPLLPKCEATLEHAARALGMSARTLQRRLDEAGLKFQAVLDEARRDMAQTYLRDPGLSLLDVSLLLGYAEQSSFTRAFRHWFGASPSAWRRRQ